MEVSPSTSNTQSPNHPSRFANMKEDGDPLLPSLKVSQNRVGLLTKSIEWGRYQDVKIKTTQSFLWFLLAAHTTANL